MKKIVLFITALTQGGAERQLLILGDQLIDHGYDVTLVTYVDAEDHYPVNSRIKRVRLAHEKPKLLKIIEIFKYFRHVDTDVVISFAERNNFLAIIGLFNRKKIKLIVSERNFMLNNNKQMQILRKLLYRRADYIVPNNYSQGEFLKALSTSIADKVRVITNYTDIYQYLQKKNYCFSDKAPLHLCVFARYDPQKNYLRTAKAVSLLKNKKNIRFTIDWFGRDVDSSGQFNKYYLEFVNIIRELRLEDVILLHSAVKDVNSALLKFDGFLLPSIYEGFSNALSEAISCGLPCIVSDVSDNKILVNDNYNGFLFDPLDIESIAIALDKFQNLSNERIISLGMNSRTKAESLFNLDEFTQKYITLFQ